MHSPIGGAAAALVIRMVMDMGSIVFLVSTVAAVLAIGLPLGLARWRRRHRSNPEQES